MQFQLLGSRESVERAFQKWPAALIRDVALDAYEVEVRATQQTELDQMVDALRAAQVSVFRMARRERTLEEVFMDLVEEAAR
jgi:hypothetical protein